MTKTKAKVFAILLLAGLLAVLAGPARAQPPKLDGFLLAGRMQAQVLRCVVLVYAEALLKSGQAEQRFANGMAAFDRLAPKLKKRLGTDQPGNENLAKYFDKLLARKRQVMKSGQRLLEQPGKGRKLKPGDIAPLEKASFQTVYAARQLMRNIVRNLEEETLSDGDNRRIAEALLLAEMQGHLLNAIKDAFADNLNCNSALADTFWLDLASFDILATAYKAGFCGAGETGEAKARALKRLTSLKHDVLMEGEAMYLVAKTCQPDLNAARTVEEAASMSLPIFESLLKEALN